MPEPATLVKEIEAHQRRMDELRENYTFREITVTDQLDPDGAVKSSDSEERDVFFVNGYRVARLVKKNGKELTEGDRKSEQDRIKKLVGKDTQAPPGHSYNRRGENAGVSQILPLMKISNPRRVSLNGEALWRSISSGIPTPQRTGLPRMRPGRLPALFGSTRRTAKSPVSKHGLTTPSALAADSWRAFAKALHSFLNNLASTRNYGCRP